MRCLLFFVIVVVALTPAWAQDTARTSEVAGETISLKTAEGVAFQCYRTGPLGARHGILLVHDDRGLTAAMRRWADDLGAAGYRVLALDLYNGKVADSANRAQEYVSALNQTVVADKYRAAIAALSAPGRKIVAMGGGFGGAQALQATLASPHRVAATVIYDGLPEVDAADLHRLRAPVLGVFARQGDVPLETVKAFETALKRANKRVKIYYYDTKSEADSATPEYFRGEPGATLWRQTQAFLQGHLR